MKIIAQLNEDPSTCSRGAAAPIVPVGMLQVREEVKVHGATVVGMMSSGLVSSLHGEDRVVS